MDTGVNGDLNEALSGGGAEPTPRPIVRLEGLSGASFAHPYDQSAMRALERLRGFDAVIAKLLEWQHERGAHMALTSSGIRVGPRQMPDIHRMLEEACRVLDMPEPELYVAPGALNAYTSGHNNPYIVLFADLVESMDDEELRAVIAHELGHIKCKHVLYKEMVRVVTQVGMKSGRSEAFKVAAQATLPFIRRALLDWDQRSELSADRAAMLVAQDESVCIRMLLKLAGAPPRFAASLNVEAFLEQAEHAQDLAFDSRIARAQRDRMLDASSHPLTVERARQLHRWVRDGSYDKVRTSPRTVGHPSVEAQVKVGRARSVPRIFKKSKAAGAAKE